MQITHMGRLQYRQFVS